MAKKINFETAMNRLDEIANIIERGEESLDTLVKLYDESIKLSAYCYKELSEAKQKISILSKESNFDDENDEDIKEF